MQNTLQRFYVIHASLAYIGNISFVSFRNEICHLLLPRNLIWVVIPRCHELSIYLLAYNIDVILNEDTVFY